MTDNEKKRMKRISFVILTAAFIYCIFPHKADRISFANVANDKYNSSDFNNTVDYGENEINPMTSNNYHDLSSDGSITLSEIISDEKIYIIQQKLKTNSHTISIKNNSGDAITVYLYNSADLKNSIQQFTLKNNTARQFTNLSASNLYNIGISCETEMCIQLTISK